MSKTPLFFLFIFLSFLFVPVLQGQTTTTLDFESGNIEGWTKLNIGEGIDITQEDTHGGKYALKMVNGTGTDAWSVQVAAPAVKLTSRNTYKVTFWVRAVGGGGKGRISTRSGNQLGGQYWPDFTVSNEWQQIEFKDLTAGGNSVELVFDMGYVAGKTYYIDDIVIEETSTIKSENEHVRMNLTVNGTSRSMLVYEPLDLPENRPLLVAFTGMNMDANGMLDGGKFWMVADTAKFVVVYPEPPASSWDQTGDSDLNFFSAIIDDMYARYKIDKKRVYITGFSWGGNFCYRIANNMADKVAAMAPIMGHSWGPNPNVAQSSHPMPIHQITGRYDDVFKPEYVPAILDKWIEWNKCATPPVVTNPYPAGSTTSTVEKKFWINEATGVEMIQLTTPHGHSVPYDPKQIMANLEIWNFCKRYSLDGKIGDETSNAEIKKPEAVAVSEEYYSLTGQKMTNPENTQQKGPFIVKVNMSDGTSQSKKIVR